MYDEPEFVIVIYAPMEVAGWQTFATKPAKDVALANVVAEMAEAL